MTDFLEGDTNFTQQTSLMIKSHLEIYNVMQVKVATLLELLSIKEISDSNKTKNRCNEDGNDLDDEKSQKPNCTI
jgi:hypothetical protein